MSTPAVTGSVRAGVATPAIPRGRLLLLAGGGIGLLVGLWSGLARAGVHEPVGPLMSHGIIMVLGFLGTLIALERAVAINRRWAYAAPALSGLSVLWLTVGLPVGGAALLLTAAGAIVVTVYVVTLRRRFDVAMALMGAGALFWLAAAALWGTGTSAIRLAVWLAAFLVLTIVGERLELSRLRVPSKASEARMVAAAAVFAVGAVLSVPAREVGLVVAGVGLLLLVAWFVRNDIARVTVRRPGLPRFAAACMLGGYGWLAVSGILFVLLGLRLQTGMLWDAMLHTLFLGFVLSMVMGHAPIIMPAVLRTPIAYRPAAWVPLVLLHASVALRVGADVAGSTVWRGWAAHGNVTALLLFVAVAVWSVRTARRSPT